MEKTNGYVSWDNAEGFAEALSEVADNFESYGSSKASQYGRTFLNTDTNISVRSDYNRADYEHYRPWESVPTNDMAILKMCNTAYEKVPIIRRAVDMMADFTVAGIRIVHPNKKINNFYQRWAKTVDFELFSERMANTLYRLANCPVKRKFGRISASLEHDWRSSSASDDIIVNKEKIVKRRIPLGYNILSPQVIEIIGGEFAAFIGKPVYALKVSMKLKMLLRKMEQQAVLDEEAKKMLQQIPVQMIERIKGGKAVIPLEQDKIELLHYKKDDWKSWAIPPVASVLDSLMMLEKMHLSDMSALDGAISQIRLWKIGSLEYKVLPTRAAINKLRNILANNVGGGVIDLVWGPDLDFKESSSNVYNFLKPEKYFHVMSQIYEGIGMPNTLTGSSKSSGSNNNLISMKTLVESLEHGRKIIKAFWDKELKLIQKAMGWRYPAKVEFDYKVLSDENLERQLLIDMWDRDLMSTERFQELARLDPELELARIKKERKQIENNNRAPKASPYHNPEIETDMKKILLQGGGVAPSELGIELLERKEGEKTQNEHMSELKIIEEKNKPVSPGGDGRPRNSLDKRQRKPRVEKRKTSAFMNLFFWANEAQAKINDMLAPVVLSKSGKKNLRSLNKAEVEEFEGFKFMVLCNLKPFSEITQESVYNIIEKKDFKADVDILTYANTLMYVYKDKYDKEPTVDEKRQIQSSSYALKFED